MGRRIPPHELARFILFTVATASLMAGPAYALPPDDRSPAPSQPPLTRQGPTSRMPVFRLGKAEPLPKGPEVDAKSTTLLTLNRAFPVPGTERLLVQARDEGKELVSVYGWQQDWEANEQGGVEFKGEAASFRKEDIRFGKIDDCLALSVVISAEDAGASIISEQYALIEGKVVRLDPFLKRDAQEIAGTPQRILAGMGQILVLSDEGLFGRPLATTLPWRQWARFSIKNIIAADISRSTGTISICSEGSGLPAYYLLRLKGDKFEADPPVADPNFRSIACSRAIPGRLYRGDGKRVVQYSDDEGSHWTDLPKLPGNCKTLTAYPEGLLAHGGGTVALYNERDAVWQQADGGSVLTSPVICSRWLYAIADGKRVVRMPLQPALSSLVGERAL